MRRSNNDGRALLMATMVCVLAAVTVFAGLYFFPERIAVFAVNNFTSCKVSYSRWHGHLLGKSLVDDLVLEVRTKGIKITAKSAEIDIDVKGSLKSRTLILDAGMRNVELFGLAGKKSGITLPNNVLAIPFSPGHLYDTVSFHIVAGRKVFALSRFEALSADTRIEGDFTFLKDRQEVDMDIKVSFSPEIAEMLPGDIRGRVLSVDPDGWYSTVIDYKGNVVFLKALFSLTS